MTMRETLHLILCGVVGGLIVAFTFLLLGYLFPPEPEQPYIGPGGYEHREGLK